MANNTDNIHFLVTHEACTLPAPLRHFAMVLARLADWRTGRGIAGQGRLARAMGCGVRTVREHKAKMAAIADSPVTVTWRHRSRPDGLNGSDAYVIVPSDTGRILLDSGEKRTTHRQDPPNNITTGSPQETPQKKEKEKSNIKALGLSDPASKLEASALRINGFHVKAAERAGLDVVELHAEWLSSHLARATLFDSQQHLRASFGGYIKRQAASTAAAPAAAEEWVWADTGEAIIK